MSDTPDTPSASTNVPQPETAVRRLIKIGSQRVEEVPPQNHGGTAALPEQSPLVAAADAVSVGADTPDTTPAPASAEDAVGSPPVEPKAEGDAVDGKQKPRRGKRGPANESTDFAMPIHVSIPSADEVDEDWAAEMGVPEDAMSRLLLGTDASGSSQELPLDTPIPATVVKIHRDSVFFALPNRQEGLCSVRRFDQPPEVGARMDVVIVGTSADDGLFELAVPGASVDIGDWSDLVEGVTVDAMITGHNAGGLECEVNHIRGFMPASQVSLYRVEDFSDYVGQKLLCVVVEANAEKRNLVLSHRGVLERERAQKREKLLEELEVGAIREGVVTNVKNFGAFVDLGGIDGLIHISQLSWDRIRHPSEVIETGQHVRVRIDKFDPQTGKISLSYRDLLDHPWQDVDQQFPIGGVVRGTVTRIMEFGAFVRVGPGLEGLVHVSELANQRVRRVDQVVSEGQEVEVKILSVDRESQRMSLSIKAAQHQEVESAEEANDSDEAPAVAIIQAPPGSLKGGVDRSSGGESFGLKW